MSLGVLTIIRDVLKGAALDGMALLMALLAGVASAPPAGMALLMALFAGVASAPPAHATAIGCSKFSEMPYLGIPTGVLCFNVYGSGENITSMDANWTTGALCNWRIDWVIYKDGKTSWRDNGPREGCQHVQGGRKRGAGRAPDGPEICAELYDVARNVKIEAVCHSIER